VPLATAIAVSSMDDSSHPSTRPYYLDVVELAAELVKRRAVKLDELLLDGFIVADKADFGG
jgi:hypothetical protein